MKSTTNMNKVKEFAKGMLYLKPQYLDSIAELLDAVYHPFFNSSFVSINDSDDFVNIMDESNFCKVCKLYEQFIDKVDDIRSISQIIQKPFKLYFLRGIQEHLSIRDFSFLLGDFWVSVEDPSGDVYVKLPTILNWFKISDKHFLMSDEERNTLNNFPDHFTVYRGVAVGRNPFGLSWTPDKTCAEWFSCRFNTELSTGYVQSLEVSKNDILAYFCRENECVIDTTKYKHKIKICN